jgi:hypothetical protein
VAVQQHAVLQLAGNIDEQQRREPGKLAHFDARAAKLLRATPVRHQLGCRLHVTCAFPVRIEHRGLVRNAHVRLKLIQDRLAPALDDRLPKALGVNHITFCSSSL